MTIVREIDNVKVYISSDIDYLKNLKEQGQPVVLVLNEDNHNEDTSFARYAVMLENENDIDNEYLRMVVARHLNKPLIIGRNDNLIVREFTVEDGNALKNLYSASEHLFLEDLISENEDGEELIKNYIEQIYDYYGYGMWAVCLDQKLIGIAGVVQRDSENDLPDLELGYFIDDAYQRKGYGYSACDIILQYVRDNISYNNIFVNVNSQNIASVKLAVKLGIEIYLD